MRYARAMVRRLPVLQESSSEPERADGRSRLQSIALGASLVVLLWLPLVLLVLPRANALCMSALGPTQSPSADRALGSGSPAAATLGAQDLCRVAAFGGLGLLVLLLAATVGGALLGHLGTAETRNDAILGGALGGVLIWLIAALAGDLGPWHVAGLALAVLTLCGAAGGWLGRRLGAPRETR